MPHPITPEEAARNATVEANLRLVPFFTKGRRHRRGWVDSEDVLQVGWLALVYAVEQHDPSRGAKLPCYARFKIVDAVARAVDDARGAYTVAERVRRDLRRWERERDRLRCEGLRPTFEEVAEAIGVHGGRRERLHAALLAPVLSITDDLDSCHAEDRETLDRVWEAVDELPEPCRTVVWLRYREGLTQAEAGERIGCTARQVERITARAVQALRRDLGVCEEVA